MKKIISGILVVLISFILVKCNSGGEDFPNTTPTTTITVNNVKYETVLGDGTWVSSKMPDGNVAGNGYIVDIYEELTKRCSFIEVNPGDELRFDISYNHNIQEVSLYTIDFTDSKKKQNALILKGEYSFKSPEKKGEYYYTFNVIWDGNHNSDYLFKIKVI